MWRSAYSDRCREGDLTLTKREGGLGLSLKKVFVKVSHKGILTTRSEIFVSGIVFFADTFEHDYFYPTGDPMAENTPIVNTYITSSPRLLFFFGAIRILIINFHKFFFKKNSWIIGYHSFNLYGKDPSAYLMINFITFVSLPSPSLFVPLEIWE